ncbi:sugar phosphate isomerase/epimerase family protein [Candidatus Latescibacterota bacterium]
MPALGAPWTAAEVSARLGLSTAVHQRSRLGTEHIAAIRQAGIERIELSIIQGCLDHRDDGQAAELLRACQSEGMAVVSVHGPFGLRYGASDEAIRKTVVSESMLGICFAEMMGAAVYVAHFGAAEHSRRTAEELVRETEGTGIVLTTENQVGEGLQPYLDVIDAVGSDRYGLTLDIGHNRDADGVNPFVRADRARATLVPCGHRLRHIHLHETFDLEEQPDHRPPLHPDGIIEWGEVFAALREIGYSGELVFEDGRGEDPEQWTRMTAEFPQAFVRKYGTP